MSAAARRLLTGTITSARQVHARHLHRIDGYSLLQETLAPGEAIIGLPFRVGGRTWQIFLYPNGIDGDHRGFLSADLNVDCVGEEEPTATYRVSILDNDGNPAHSKTVGQRPIESYMHSMSRSNKGEKLARETAIDELVAVEELRRSAPFVLRDDRLTVQCDVSVLVTETKRWTRRWFME